MAFLLRNPISGFGLAAVLFLYLAPVLFGFGWNADGPQTPHVTGYSGHQQRSSSGTVSVEHFGTGVVEVGLSARIDEYIRRGALPLWNRHQGLGQPFAAMGDGNPYSLARIARALLPYPDEIFIALLLLPLSGLATFGLVRVLGASHAAATVTAAMWMTNGSLFLHLARPNLFDQVAMLPVLFLGVAYAIQRRTALACLAGALGTLAFVLAGFPQIGALGVATAAVFALASAFTEPSSRRNRPASVGLGAVAIALGLALAAFYLLPLAETLVTAWEPRAADHGALPTPPGNLAAFFLPVLAGTPLRNWMPGGYPDVTDWNNLYGQSSTLALVLLCTGVASFQTMPRQAKVTFGFFALAGLVLVLKFGSIPPATLLNYLPLIGEITPKHTNGLAAFLFVIASGLALDHLRADRIKLGRRLAIGVLTAAGLVTLYALYVVREQGGYDLRLAAVSIFETGLIFWAALMATRVASDRGLKDGKALVALLAVIIAEGQAYLLLGNGSVEFALARTGVAGLVLGTAFLWSTGLRSASGATASAAIIGYAAMVALWTDGLPERVDLRRPEPYMTFLKARDADAYRTFGITADYSAIGGIDDLSTTGPFAPYSFRRFVRLVSDEPMNRFFNSATKFWLDRGDMNAAHFSLDQYVAMRDVFDFVGVKYLVLPKRYFRPPRRTDQLPLLGGPNALPIAFEDENVWVLMSPGARPKAEFFSSVASIASDEDAIDRLRLAPGEALSRALVPATAVAAPLDGGPPVAATIVREEPNYATVNVEASGPGVLVMKEAFSPGWRARVNGAGADILPVDGFLQGVFLPEKGRYVVEFEYLTDGFRLGIVVSGGALLLAFGILIAGLRPKRAPSPLAAR